MIRWDTLNIRC